MGVYGTWRLWRARCRQAQHARDLQLLAGRRAQRPATSPDLCAPGARATFDEWGHAGTGTDPQGPGSTP